MLNLNPRREGVGRGSSKPEEGEESSRRGLGPTGRRAHGWEHSWSMRPLREPGAGALGLVSVGGVCGEGLKASEVAFLASLGLAIPAPAPLASRGPPHAVLPGVPGGDAFA